LSITINEMTITVPGNVVKTFTADGKDSLLRVTQDQAQNIFDALGPVLKFFAVQNNGGIQAVLDEMVKDTTPVSAVGAGALVTNLASVNSKAAQIEATK
jgi:hypothetical protein